MLTVKTKTSRSVLSHYLITYFIVLFIPLLICCSYYIRMISAIGEDDILMEKEELEHAAVLVDTMLEDFSYLGDTLAGNIKVNTFRNMADAFEYPNTWKLIEMQETLPEMYQINPSVFDYYIFFGNSEMVVNKHIAYQYRDFYDLYLREKVSESYEKWYTRMKEEKPSYGLCPAETFLFKNGAEMKMLVYTRPLFANSAVVDNSAVRIFFEASALERLMPVMPENSMQYIWDSGGNEIYGKENGEPCAKEAVKAAIKQAAQSEGGSGHTVARLNGRSYFVLTYASEKSGLTYCTLQPQIAVSQRKITSVILLTVCVSLAAAVGMALSFHMSLKSATPILDILKAVSRETEKFESHQSVFSSLKATVQNLVSTNSDLAEAIGKQKPYIRNAFINRLIFGNFMAAEETDKLASHIGIEYKNRVYCVVIFRFCLAEGDIGKDNLNLMSSCVLSLMEIMERIWPDSLYTGIGNEQVILLVNSARTERDSLRRMIEQIVLRIKEEMPANISEKMFVYGGNEVYGLSEVHESYNNAAYMFHNEKRQIENAVIWYVENQGSIPLYPSADFSVKLTHYVTSGDLKGLHDELERLMGTYIIENNLPIYLQHMLLNELQAVVFRILGRAGMDEEEYRKYYDELEENQNASLIEQITRTLNLFRKICGYINAQKQELDSGSLMPSVVSYIDSNFGDSNLSLVGVADIFQISETYLSAVFKQTTGINFSSYVEGVRIDKAKEFLKTTSMPVSEIAQRVGYYSANSFCRAFKRVTGISASEYRKK